jgi:hypothetical protein
MMKKQNNLRNEEKCREEKTMFLLSFVTWHFIVGI